jgi:hypothetical protein
MAHSVYCKLKLDPNKEQYRFITLIQGEKSEHITCQLKTHSIENIRYEALSYEWGDSIKKESITVGGTYLKVTVNLATALRHLRYLDRPRTLWVDAICINQDDNEEKMAQILKMRKLYCGASPVLAWLGEEHGCSD